ncbi:MAG: gamma-glutamylcyclotransferase [Pseudomonadota bacterium]
MTRTMPHRLAVYGTLAPGRANHHKLSHIAGGWSKGHVTGTLIEAGWGARVGYPGLVLQTGGVPVPVDILESPDLPLHWATLDAFEGADYARVTTIASTEAGPVEVSLYVIRSDAAE